jgi:dGTPase
VAAASLAHDIESAFGHSGEKPLRVFFDRKRTKNKDQLTAKEWQDLIDFEGNAFSVLTASRPGIEGGLFRMQLWCFYEISKEFT